jgi:hypothetical protein
MWLAIYLEPAIILFAFLLLLLRGFVIDGFYRQGCSSLKQITSPLKDRYLGRL